MLEHCLNIAKQYTFMRRVKNDLTFVVTMNFSFEMHHFLIALFAIVKIKNCKALFGNAYSW